MVGRDFSGRDVVKVLDHGYRIESRSGSHVTPSEVTDGGTFRRVTVPMHDRIRLGTLRDIAADVGASDFERFCAWIDENR